MSVSVPRTRICDSEITDGEILWHDRASCLAVYILLHVTFLPLNKNFFCKKRFIYSIATALESLLFIGVGAGKFLGARRIFARFSQNVPGKHLGQILCEHFLKQTFFWDELAKQCLHMILQTLGAILPRFSEILRRFSQILPRFPRLFLDFQGLCPDFHQITRRTPASYTTTSGRS